MANKHTAALKRFIAREADINPRAADWAYDATTTAFGPDDDGNVYATRMWAMVRVQHADVGKGVEVRDDPDWVQRCKTFSDRTLKDVTNDDGTCVRVRGEAWSKVRKCAAMVDLFTGIGVLRFDHDGRVWFDAGMDGRAERTPREVGKNRAVVSGCHDVVPRDVAARCGNPGSAPFIAGNLAWFLRAVPTPRKRDDVLLCLTESMLVWMCPQMNACAFIAAASSE